MTLDAPLLPDSAFRALVFGSSYQLMLYEVKEEGTRKEGEEKEKE